MVTVLAAGLEGDDDDEDEKAKQEKLAREAEAAEQAAAAKEAAGAADGAAADADEDMLDIDESEFDADDLDKLAEEREVRPGVSQLSTSCGCRQLFLGPGDPTTPARDKSPLFGTLLARKTWSGAGSVAASGFVPLTAKRHVSSPGQHVDGLA